MKGIKVHICSHTDQLPSLPSKDFFHSAELMAIYEATPRIAPFMAVAEGDDGTPLAHLLAVVRHRSTVLPPFFYTHCFILGDGEYADGIESREEVFGMMVEALLKKLQNRVLYVEVANISSKMFAYKEFRRLSFFPIHWMSIHNSIHSRTPEERAGERTLRHIDHAVKRGATTSLIDGVEDINAIIRLLNSHNLLKPKRYVPDRIFFERLACNDNAKIHITKVRNHVVGCSVAVHSMGDLYLWYAAFRRKSYAYYHPDFMTIWSVLKSAQAEGYAHVRFIDVGLPFRRNPLREFILRFGGKPVSTYRWFRCSWQWLNALLSWIYRI